ncbi:MAG: hypothetical protein IT365_15450 [Candidatus Hydrogenedentes bacterium]|nr:hypothetical protein [Candidatus Hydrogenedentota bacterium]
MKRNRTRLIVLISFAGVALALVLTAALALSVYHFAFRSRTLVMVGTDKSSVTFSRNAVGHSNPPVVYESGGYDQIEPRLRKVQTSSVPRWRFTIRPVGEKYGLEVRKDSGNIEAEMYADGENGRMNAQSVLVLVQDLGLHPAYIERIDADGNAIAPPSVEVVLSGTRDEMISILQRLLEGIYKIGPENPLEIQSEWDVPVPG